MKLRNIIILSALVVISSCKKEIEKIYKEYTEVELSEISTSNSGAAFKAEILSFGKYKILEYGFVWAEEKSKPVLSDFKISLGTNLTTSEFSTTVQSDLAKGKKYYVRAYVQTGKYLIYSKEKVFTSEGSLAPEISSFSPSSGLDGTFVTIKGKNFSKIASRNIVKIGPGEAKVTSATENEIVIQTPYVSYSGDFKITVEAADQTATSKNSYSIIGPIITSVTPEQIKQGDIVTIRGHNLKIGNYPTYASINESGATTVTLDTNKMVVIVPIIREYQTLQSGLKVTVNNKIATYNLSLLQTWFKMNSLNSVAVQNDLFSITDRGYCLVNKKLYEYSPGDNSWNFKSDFPGNISSGSFKMVIGNKLYMGGGLTSDQTNSKEFWKYDQSTNGWTRLSDINDYNTALSPWSFSLDGLGYIWSRNGNFWCFNPASGQWISKNPIQNSDDINGAVILNNKAYISRGRSLWEYNPAADNFSFKTTCPYGSENKGGIALQNNFFGIYSYGNPYSYNFLYKYNAELNVWCYMQDYPCTGGAVIPAFALQDKVYFGNFTGVGNSGCEYTLFYVIP